MSETRQILLPAPSELVGERVVVRPYADQDAPAMYEAIQESIEHLRPWMPWYGQHASVTDTLQYIRRCQAHHLLREDFPMGIFARAGGEFLGGTGLHTRDIRVPFYEIGYWVRASAEGKGFVTEAVRLLTMHAFETMGVRRLLIHCNAANTRSARVAERLGYPFEGRLRNFAVDTSGNLADILMYAMIPEDYERAKEAW